MMKEMGFKSAYEQVHGKEPDVTFQSKIDSPFAATEPDSVFDYIFYKGPAELEPITAELSAGECMPGRPDLYASDHLALVSEFKL